ncbi:MAG TPA: glycosyltransferase family 4 protein [Candidatus Acidoferrales bacterium]|nr:glycosyltransferase family 4 protein [Candidatus Acidoferrales bacterium]
MRIAQVAPLHESVPSKRYGGTERVVSWLTEELVRRGHRVTLFASGDSLTAARLVSVCQSSLRTDPACKDTLAYHVLMLEQVAKRAHEFDVVHFHVDYLHFPISRRIGTPHVTTLHGRMDVPELVPIFQEFDDVPVISISMAQRRPLPFANWVGNVYHGLPADSMQFHAAPGKYLAFLGRFSPEKRPDRAIEIAKRSGMPLKIAAKVDRADREYFESKIKPLLDCPLVEYVGEISDREKSDFLGNAFASLFPIDWPEPFGINMIEAMACGTPTIAFPGGSVPEIMRDGVTGFVVNSVEEAVESLDRVRQISRKACRREFERRFTAPRMTSEYLAIYEAFVQPEPMFEQKLKLPGREPRVAGTRLR